MASTTSEATMASLPPAVVKAYDLLLWVMNHVSKFPRSHRFVLGERIETKMLAILELLIEAAFSRHKSQCLHNANRQLQVIRLLLRVGKDLGFTSLRQYEFVTGELVRLGQQIGGWSKQAGEVAHGPSV
ncbi:MAG: diversity-generating retroelement protein Avd [Nitrospira sp.]|nr:diversity-generating retroelement protein Avd [Nitrospira sp.]